MWFFSGAVAFLRALFIGTGGGGTSYSRIARDLVLYGLAAALGCARRWLRLEGAATPSDPLPAAPPPLPDAELVDGKSLVSVVIPTYNEGDGVSEAVRAALRDAHVEVIVADGGSTDGTPERARAAGATVIDAPPGRASCQNAGAAAARGAILLFLHGDTLLPEAWGEMLRAALRQPRVAIAAYRLSLYPRLPGISIIEWGTYRRSSRRGLPYGDQALGLRREVFDALGGFPVQPFLEDLHLVLEARRRGVVLTMDASVRSSARRWELNGVLGNTFRNQCVLLGYMVGVPIPRIAEWYYGAQGKKKY